MSERSPYMYENLKVYPNKTVSVFKLKLREGASPLAQIKCGQPAMRKTISESKTTYLIYKSVSFPFALNNETEVSSAS